MSWFVVSLHYIAPLSAIDGAMRSHVAFLEKHRKSGVFIAWGRKVPRSGGIILACGESRAAIERIMNDDPFVMRRLAEMEVTEFLPKPAPVVEGVQRLLDPVRVIPLPDDPLAAFRGSGKGGTVKQLLKDRRRERKRNA